VRHGNVIRPGYRSLLLDFAMTFASAVASTNVLPVPLQHPSTQTAPLPMSSLLTQPPPTPLWRWSPTQGLLIGLVCATLLISFYPTLEFMVSRWAAIEEYSYGYFIAPICAFLIWQRSDELRKHELVGSWVGLLLIALALAMGAVGQLSAIRLLSQYGFLIGVFGISLASIGWRGTRIIAAPLAMLAFMIPLPPFVLRELSHSLQLLSSQLGVALIRLFDISVHLEGNVIDLGSYKLQVVEACNGLRYLFPLMVLGCLVAYFFNGPVWKRVLIIASTVPLTIAINSLRIGLIGVTVEHWGPQMAEGLLHDLEGWFMFMICLGLLMAEVALLARFGKPRQSLFEALALDAPSAPAKGQAVSTRRTSGPGWAAGLALVGAAVFTLVQPERKQNVPPRQSFISFPMEFDAGWRGKPDSIAPDVLAALALDDYVIANYQRPGEPWVNLYSAYYASQSGGESTHSPRTCIPGDGWTIVKLEQVVVPLDKTLDNKVASLVATDLPNANLPNASAAPLRVNRAIIQKGEHRHLVYYWFVQRGRTLTDEVEVKWYILRDALTRDRSDGALIRMITPIGANEDPAMAEQRIVSLLGAVQPRLPAFIPN
jgi:exosortase D (VPLPA-CTERM-specific)